MAKEIAKRIEEELALSGEISDVIRETRLPNTQSKF